MNSDKILQDIMDLSVKRGVTNSQFKKEVQCMVSFHLHGKDMGGMSRKDRVKVMTNSHEQLDEYLKQEKEQQKLEEEG